MYALCVCIKCDRIDKYEKCLIFVVVDGRILGQRFGLNQNQMNVYVENMRNNGFAYDSSEHDTKHTLSECAIAFASYYEIE